MKKAKQHVTKKVQKAMPPKGVIVAGAKGMAPSAGSYFGGMPRRSK